MNESKTIVLYPVGSPPEVHDRCVNVKIFSNGNIIEFDYANGHVESNLPYKILG